MNLNSTAAWLGAAPLLLASSVATPAMADDFNGCAFRGVDTTCLMVRSGRNTFNVTAARPRPDLGRHLGIVGAGTRSGKVSSCGQGIVLENIHWSYTRQQCPGNDGRPSARRR